MIPGHGAFTIHKQGTQYKAKKKDMAIEEKVSCVLKLGYFLGKVIIGCTLKSVGL